MVIVPVSLMLIGLALGSFAGAQVWRLRARQLVQDKAAGEAYDTGEYKKLVKLTTHRGAHDRSRCLSCGHLLAWYDLIPLVSWLTIGGKCRYCHTRIGLMEPLIEAGVASVFVLSYWLWPFSLTSGLEWARFGVWLVACVLMAILLVYDAKWSLLPFGVNIGLVVTGAVFLVLTQFITPFGPDLWISFAVAVSILAGLYFLFSLAGWVGLGDSILGLGLAMFAMSWERAFLALFVANLLGCLALIPIAVRHELKKGMHVPFGPFLILGAVIAVLWGAPILDFLFGSAGPFINTLMI